MKARGAIEGKPNRDNCYDLAVIGAGPAGALTAALCAEGGLSTILIEKKKLPRYKPCGGFISERALALLPNDLKLPYEAYLTVNELEIVIGARYYHYHSQNRLGLVMKREDFDFCLAQYAKDRGAKLIEGYAVKNLQPVRHGSKDDTVYAIKSVNETLPPLYARYIVGADGAVGRVTNYVRQKKNIYLKTGLGLTGIDKTGDSETANGFLTFYPLPASGGMGWSFHGRGWVNRGVGGLSGRKKLEQIYRKLFPEQDGSVELTVWPLPFLGPLQNAGEGNLLLVGDAAGLVDPFSGEGLFNSFLSARLASISLIDARADNKTPGLYYAGLFRNHFYRRFPGALFNAFALHTRALANPAAMPRLFANLMKKTHSL